LTNIEKKMRLTKECECYNALILVGKQKLGISVRIWSTNGRPRVGRGVACRLSPNNDIGRSISGHEGSKKVADSDHDRYSQSVIK
jgi:hypothetical protein